ncbi:PC4-domain-containing protein [Pleomassaria siparia CBS 279.74]|uniref:PC4-domain-containing protein n=1 Tax=Pleomassaria siparia CBS 279.74 TaxID=1314801 RepID=A0A6G1KGU2_9PLEO|nr:PC4-domain-containing protein [Pleomassaria siparia CBS 279.74]
MAGGSKFTKRPARRNLMSDDDDAPRASKKARTDDEDTEPFVPTLEKDDDGCNYVSLKSSGLRRATISRYKGKNMIDIREYYEKDGEKLPARKGISLTIDQYNALLFAAPLIESVLRKKKVDVVRPDYGEAAGETEEAEEAHAPVDQAAKDDEEEPVLKAEDEEEPVIKADDEEE